MDVIAQIHKINDERFLNGDFNIPPRLRVMGAFNEMEKKRVANRKVDELSKHIKKLNDIIYKDEERVIDGALRSVLIKIKYKLINETRDLLKGLK
jgi:hypothetical protein